MRFIRSRPADNTKIISEKNFGFNFDTIIVATNQEEVWKKQKK